MSISEELTERMLADHLTRMKGIAEQGAADSQRLMDQLHEHVANPLLMKVQQAGEAAKLFKEIVTAPEVK